MFVLPNCLIDCDSGKEYARKATSNRKPFMQSFSGVATARISDSNDDRRTAHNPVPKLKTDDRLSGKIGENVSEYIANYTEAAPYYELGSSQKLLSFQNLFSGEAKSFYWNHVQAMCIAFERACNRTPSRFSSIARQDIARKYLPDLSLTSVIEKKSWNVSKVLEELREVITKSTP